MKTRQGFVSNSSSSSFIVINNNKEETNERIQRLYGSFKGTDLVVDENFGTYKFGWEYDKHRDFGSKIIFCYLQARNSINDEDRSKWFEMLEKVLKDKLGVVDIRWNLGDNGYVDHQSSSWEGQNIEMFDSEEELIDFIFNPHSFIQTDNDNY